MNCLECQDKFCCKTLAAVLSKDELHLEKELVPLKENNMILGYVFVIKKINDVCFYLKDELCSIYNKRPNVCRKFDCAGRI